jgi:trans-aconitate methyltransferase
MWAVCTDPTKEGRKWNSEDFFATGEREINTVINHVEHLGIHPNFEGTALDFGCGVGRLTQALAKRFKKTHGVDISSTMIDEAKRFNAFGRDCEYHVNSDTKLRMFRPRQFDFIYTSIVLQHIPTKYISKYIRALLHLLKPSGIFVFQVPDRLVGVEPLKGSVVHRIRASIRLRSRLRSMLKHTKQPPALVMAMNALSEPAVRKLLEKSGARLVDIQMTNSTDAAFNGELRYLDSKPTHGWVSKQYCVIG